MTSKQLITTLMLCVSAAGYAQHQSVYTPETTVASQVAVGASNCLDTYLSPEKYRGVETRFVSEVCSDSKKRPLTYLLTHEGAFAYDHNRTVTAHEYMGHYDFSYSVMRRWQMADDKLLLRAGTMCDAMLGFCYNSRNGNNPAQGYATAALGAQVMAAYQLNIFGRNVTLGYEARLPMLGLMFSPAYGQSYYELFTQGDYDHNIVFTSIATFQLRQQLSVDIPVGQRTSLRVAYLGDIRQAEPNNLKQHHYYNAATIGIVLKK